MSRTVLTAADFSEGIIKNVKSSLITENEVDRVLGPQQMIPNILHLIKLINDPHSSQLVDRHEKYVRRLCGHIKARGGVLLSELVDLFRAIELLSNRVDENIIYGECLIEMVQLMGGALLKAKTSDEQKYRKIAIEALEQLALLLRIPFLNVRKTVIRALFHFWEQRPQPVELRRCNHGPGRDHKAAVYRNCSKEFQELVIEESKVVQTLVQSTPLLDPLDKLAALRVLEQLTQNSAKNSLSTISTGGAQVVALMLAEADKKNVPMLIDILWNCIQNSKDKTEIVNQLSSLTSITSINSAFMRLMKESHSKSEKETRNDLLVLITQIAQYNPSAPFVETSFLSEIIKFGCSNERNLTNSELDFEFLRMLLTCASILTEDGAALRYLQDGPLLKYLMLPVQRLDEQQVRSRSLYQWSSSQKEELQLLSLQLVTKIAPKIGDKFLELNGPNALMAFLFWSFQTDYSGHGNSILGTGGRGSARAQCRFALRCIRSLCTPTRDPFDETDDDSNRGDEVQIIHGFVEEGIIDLLLLTLSNVNNINTDQEYLYIEDDQIDLEIQEDMLVIISLIADINQKELVATNLIDILIFYLKDLPGKVVNGIRRQQLLLSVIDCIFSAILGYEDAEIKFLELEGAFLLIDLLDTLPHEMHGVVLTCLIELTENPKTMSHFMTWRSSKVEVGQPPVTLAGLLIKLWKDEEKRIGCQRGPRGELSNICYPMAGTSQIQATKDLKQPSPALSEIGDNCRVKIYCLMWRIGFNDQLPGVDTEDYVTLALIEKYYDFKVSEVWNEIINELEHDNIKLIDADGEAAETIKQAQSERARGIQNLQDQLKEAKMMQDKQDEQNLFEKIREKYRQSGRMIQRWHEYIERTSNYDKLLQAKKNMGRQINQSKIRSKNARKTIQHKNRLELNTTTFQGRRITIESTPSAITRTPDPKY